jgi:hypothetical protein
VNFIIRTSLLAALVFVTMPTRAIENDLELRIINLENRVNKLETLGKGDPSEASENSTPGNWKDLKNWRQLHTGMSYDAVRKLLGEPENIDGGTVATWYWDNREVKVVFISGQLYSWSEPR